MFQGLSYDLAAPIQAVIDSGLMVSLCTIQQRTNAVDSMGQVDLADWVDIAGLISIPCMFSVQNVNAPDKAAEMRYDESIDTSNYRHVLLNDYYPTILQQYQAVVDGTPYEIMAAESDSQHTMTRLAVRAYKQ